jgi:uncharacterized protein (TIGR02996 family)
MNHANAFLQAIAENPDDDAHRLIYADWLEERGDPRGTFIRAQCRLADMALDDPARDDLEDEADDLLAAHEEEWTEHLQGVADDWRFERGFPERVFLSPNAFLGHGERLFVPGPVRHIHFREPNYHFERTASTLAGCTWLDRVETLDFQDSRLREPLAGVVSWFPHLKRLRGLRLAGCPIEASGVQALAVSLLPQLTSLDFSGCHTLGDRVVRILATAPGTDNLQHLSLANTNVTAWGVRDLFTSTRLARLTNLSVAMNGVGQVNQGVVRDLRPVAHDLAGSPLLKRLRCLDLSGNGIGNERWGSQVLAGSSALAQLQTLGLAGCGIRDEDVRALFEHPESCGLEVLDLSGNVISGQGVWVMSISSDLSKLKALYLNGNPVKDVGARALAASMKLTGLTTLELRGASIGGPGIEALAASQGLSRLRELDLSENFVNLASVRALADSEYLTRLTVLRLANNRLGDEEAQALAQSPRLARLRELQLNGNRIGAEELARSPHLRRLTKLVLSGLCEDERRLLRERFGNGVVV